MWLTGAVAVCAQPLASGDPPVAIAKSAHPDPVTAGQELTYALSLTNTGSITLAGVVVMDMVPRHTTFVLSSSPGGDWWTRTPSLGEQGEIVWRLNGPLAPGQVSHLRFVVKTDADNAAPIVSQGCQVVVEGQSMATCEPVTTQVLRSISTSTPLPTSSPTTAVLALVGPTPLPAASPPAISLPTPQKDDVTLASFLGQFFGRELLIGLVVLTILLLVSAWLVKRRS